MYTEANGPTLPKGEFYVEFAHTLTQFRADIAPYVETAIASTDEDPAVTTFVAGVMATDGADGYYARKGAALLGIPTSEKGAIEDPKADKELANAVMRGLIARYVRQKDYVSAGIMTLNLGASQWRDRNMAENRALIAEASLDPEMLKAIPINKLKTFLQMNASLAAMNSSKGSTRHLALLCFTAGTLTGVIGERKYRKSVRKLLENHSLRTLSALKV